MKSIDCQAGHSSHPQILLQMELHGNPLVAI
jgi:hypothetical protein